MQEIKTNLFSKDFEKLLDTYNINGVFTELDDEEVLLFTVGGNTDVIKVRLNDNAINKETFKKILEKLYKLYCIEDDQRAS